MKMLLTSIALFLLGANALGQSEKMLGVFAATTPCGSTIRPVHKIPDDGKCDIVIWELQLYQDENGRPTTFRLDSEYRFYLNNQTSESMGTNKDITGTWSITKGTKGDPDASVYTLTTKAGVALRFHKLGDNLLHPLEDDRSLMVGNGGWSYTLSRIK